MWKKFLLFMAICSSTLVAEESKIKILAFSGSTRKGSLNKKLVTEATQIAQKKGAHITFIDLKNYPMPFYDGDLEATTGQPWNAKKFREELSDHHIIFISTPEYNGAISAVLKNALDWASRNEKGHPSYDAFIGKKFVLMSASPGSQGGIRGLTNLKMILESAGGIVIPGEMSIPHADTAFDEHGHLIDHSQQKELNYLVESSLKCN